MSPNARPYAAGILVCLLASRLPAQSDLPVERVEAAPVCDASAPTCPQQLRGWSRCRLEDLFRHGTAHVPPVGAYRGDILLFTDFYRCPKLSRRLSGLAWKGKHFEEGGTFINQFASGKALRSCVGAGSSWLDGQPAVVLEYADGTPLFGTTRDEIRQVAPELYVVMLFERTTGEVRGILALSPRR